MPDGQGGDDKLLSEDKSDIKPVPAAVRRAWERKRDPYTREDYERDKAARANDHD
jgi:hypothetical protein